MQRTAANHISALALGALLAITTPAIAENTQDKAHSHDHSSEDIYKGIFSDDQIAPRQLSDWAGDWQSVYPLLQDGSLDSVMQDKAAHGDKTADEYKAYYTTGYATDVDRILIEGNAVTFFREGEHLQANYADDGYEVLNYESGNRGVRFIFKKVDGDTDAPGYIQFSDHRIAPEVVDHYHLYWGDDRAAILKELTNWPTYFPAALSGEDIVAEMLAH